MKEDVKLTVKDGTLTIQGERNQAQRGARIEIPPNRAPVWELHAGFSLPEGVLEDKLGCDLQKMECWPFIFRKSRSRRRSRSNQDSPLIRPWCQSEVPRRVLRGEQTTIDHKPATARNQLERAIPDPGSTPDRAQHSRNGQPCLCRSVERINRYDDQDGGRGNRFLGLRRCGCTGRCGLRSTHGRGPASCCACGGFWASGRDISVLDHGRADS